MPKIAIIIGSTRATRFADKPAVWLKNIVDKRTDAEFEFVDLRDFSMPFFDEVASSRFVPSTDEVAQRWQKKLPSSTGISF